MITSHLTIIHLNKGKKRVIAGISRAKTIKIETMDDQKKMTETAPLTPPKYPGSGLNVKRVPKK